MEDDKNSLLNCIYENKGIFNFLKKNKIDFFRKLHFNTQYIITIPSEDNDFSFDLILSLGSENRINVLINIYRSFYMGFSERIFHNQYDFFINNEKDEMEIFNHIKYLYIHYPKDVINQISKIFFNKSVIGYERMKKIQKIR